MELLNKKQAAAMLHISVPTLNVWRRKGIICEFSMVDEEHRHRAGRRIVRFEKSEVERVLRNHRAYHGTSSAAS